MQFRSVNPYDGKVLRSYKGTSEIEVSEKIELAHQAYLQWRKTTFSDRSTLLKSAGSELLNNIAHYSKSITLEMGKPLKESIAEIYKCAKVCEYYAVKAEDFLRDSPLETPHGEAYIHYNPIGAVLAVMPWNFPFWQVFRFAAPAIMAGNTCLLKHASNVPGCAMDIEKVFKNTGFPKGIFSTLLIGAKDVGSVINHKLVSAVTLTGSELAGKSVAGMAGNNLKKR